MTAEKKVLMVRGIALAGNVTGVIVAVKRKSGFWGGVGWFILGGLAGAAVGFIAASVIPGEDMLNPTETKPANETV